MKRTAIAAAWVVGATVPALMAVVFVFGCCVLPFHGYLHRVMPLCHLAVDFIGGAHGDHDDNTRPIVPAREKQEPVKRVATSLPRLLHLAALVSTRQASPFDATVYRSFISLGAIRCDQDVGLYLLAGTLLI